MVLKTASEYPPLYEGCITAFEATLSASLKKIFICVNIWCMYDPPICMMYICVSVGICVPRCAHGGQGQPWATIPASTRVKIKILWYLPLHTPG